ncbi:hypothetical protein ABIB35_001012 [Arthrobacter sp. UYP6]|uniref:DUF2891 family protein n=1 Tax=Arthrobacter sp. UYP6 TaxID=1756378 RepID=UPI0033930041
MTAETADTADTADTAVTDHRRGALASVYADVVLDNLRRTYPFASHHVQTSPEDRPSPCQLHPSFHSSFDWQSCVHMHWLGVSLLEYGLDAGRDAALRAALGASLSPENLAVEGAYLLAHPGWERPYGWAWLVRLAEAAAGSTDPQIRGWGTALDPLADIVAQLVADWTAKVDHPVRHGIHTNSAFGVGMLYSSFRALERTEAAETCAAAARRWFGGDTGWAAEWELSGQDFLSAGLSEADLMARILEPASFARWFSAFLPGLTPSSRLLQPVAVSDETDGYMVHLHGLNLSRAGQIARILPVLEAAGDAGAIGAAALRVQLDPLLEAGLEAVVTTEFLSSHWLASFAWDALTSRSAWQR